jgi:hypothetical protein
MKHVRKITYAAVRQFDKALAGAFRIVFTVAVWTVAGALWLLVPLFCGKEDA